ncbi:MAG: NADH-quinone oxidoreductase subunit M [Verrucomicrobia bacterium]|nr:NADH-quinone oxidoreductase subunit M [Verrucomicrobiota bacterium]
MNLLPWTLYVSFAGALLALLAGTRSAAAARRVALGTALAGLAITLLAAREFVPGPELQTLVNVPWITELGVRYHLAVDGISLSLLVLTGLAATAGILFSWNNEERTGEFFAFYLSLIGGVYGVFMSADVFLLFVFYEIAIVPKYFLVAVWGSTNREYGAMKLVLYSFAGSALVLIGLLWAHAAGGATGYGLAELAEGARHIPAGSQIAIFALLFLGFAVLAGLFPFHTWAPTGHVAAPTGASMLLAGVVMKLGAYGCLRVAMPLFPGAFAVCQPVIAWLAIAGIVYAGFIALVQSDFKFVIGYSSVSHMGFVLLGLAAATPLALAGAVLQMVSHGIIAGLLFAVVGRMVYERTHTRELAALQAMPLHRLLPFAAGVFVLAGFASLGLPGFSGFPAELSILTGTWQAKPLWAVCAALGIVVAGAFTLRAIHVAFFGSTGATALLADAGHHDEAHAMAPISWPEKTGALLLLAATLWVGLKPDVLLDWIVPALQSPAFKAVINGGTP